jgi:hypothetical protein
VLLLLGTLGYAFVRAAKSAMGAGSIDTMHAPWPDLEAEEEDGTLPPPPPSQHAAAATGTVKAEKAAVHQPMVTAPASGDGRLTRMRLAATTAVSEVCGFCVFQSLLSQSLAQQLWHATS